MSSWWRPKCRWLGCRVVDDICAQMQPDAVCELLSQLLLRVRIEVFVTESYQWTPTMQRSAFVLKASITATGICMSTSNKYFILEVLE